MGARDAFPIPLSSYIYDVAMLASSFSYNYGGGCPTMLSGHTWIKCSLMMASNLCITPDGVEPAWI